jgi:hypothetical protein
MRDVARRQKLSPLDSAFGDAACFNRASRRRYGLATLDPRARPEAT